MKPNPEIPRFLMPEPPPRRFRWWLPLLGILALLVAGLLWCRGEAEASDGLIYEEDVWR